MPALAGRPDDRRVSGTAIVVGARRWQAIRAQRADGGYLMMVVDRARTPRDLVTKIERMFALSAAKIDALEQNWRPEDGAPVFTVQGRYCARGWTEWTQGFQFGSAILQFDATADRAFLELGRARTLDRMAPHLTHVG